MAFFYVKGCGVSSAECHVYLVGLNIGIGLASFVVCIYSAKWHKM